MLRTLNLAAVVVAAACASGLALAASGHPDRAAGAPLAHAELNDGTGKRVGHAELRDTPAGVLVHLTLTAVPQGTHAVHLHAIGECAPPSFDSAGGHANPTAANHGLMNADGPHAGDLPNLHVPESGALEVELLAAHASLAGPEAPLLDDDGAAIVIHAGPDDYRTEPAGDAGARIACGVVTR